MTSCSDTEKETLHNLLSSTALPGPIVQVKGTPAAGSRQLVAASVSSVSPPEGDLPLSIW